MPKLPSTGVIVLIACLLAVSGCGSAGEVGASGGLISRCTKPGVELFREAVGKPKDHLYEVQSGVVRCVYRAKGISIVLSLAPASQTPGFDDVFAEEPEEIDLGDEGLFGRVDLGLDDRAGVLVEQQGLRLLVVWEAARGFFGKSKGIKLAEAALKNPAWSTPYEISDYESDPDNVCQLLPEVAVEDQLQGPTTPAASWGPRGKRCSYLIDGESDSPPGATLEIYDPALARLVGKDPDAEPLPESLEQAREIAGEGVFEDMPAYGEDAFLFRGPVEEGTQAWFELDGSLASFKVRGDFSEERSRSILNALAPAIQGISR